MRCIDIEDGKPALRVVGGIPEVCRQRERNLGDPRYAASAWPKQEPGQEALEATTYRRLRVACGYCDIPIRSITPSNEVSYSRDLRVPKSREILISGDTGCVDFKPTTSKEVATTRTCSLA